MGVLSLRELEAGMVLEQPVCNSKGVMLLPAGTRLTEKHLVFLKQWGVRRAAIEGTGRETLTGEAAAQLDPKLLEAIDSALDEKFAPDHDEIMAEVKRIVRKMAIEEAIRRHQEGL